MTILPLLCLLLLHPSHFKTLTMLETLPSPPRPPSAIAGSSCSLSISLSHQHSSPPFLPPSIRQLLHPQYHPSLLPLLSLFQSYIFLCHNHLHHCAPLPHYFNQNNNTAIKASVNPSLDSSLLRLVLLMILSIYFKISICYVSQTLYLISPHFHRYCPQHHQSITITPKHLSFSSIDLSLRCNLLLEWQPKRIGKEFRGNHKEMGREEDERVIEEGMR